MHWAVKVAATWRLMQTIAAGHLHGVSMDTGNCPNPNVDQVAMIQIATEGKTSTPRAVQHRSPADTPPVKGLQLPQTEVRQPPLYIKEQTKGYCKPQTLKGDLCNPEHNPDDHTVACADAVADTYYLPAHCGQECARYRCQGDSACVGFTYNIKKQLYKLKSIINNVRPHHNFECFRKPVPPTTPHSDANYQPIDWLSKAEGGGYCPGSDDEDEIRFSIPSEDAQFGTCAKSCSTDSDCPPSPVGTTPICDWFYKTCFVRCGTKGGVCQQGARCVFGEICTYRLSRTARRLPDSSETHYNYPVFRRRSQEDPDAMCFGQGKHIWFERGALYVACAAPCDADSDCPTDVPAGTLGTPMCHDVGLGYRNRCYISCSNILDCPYGGVCLLGHDTPKCAFPI